MNGFTMVVTLLVFWYFPCASFEVTARVHDDDQHVTSSSGEASDSTRGVSPGGQAAKIQGLMSCLKWGSI
jgi:hypothetical protein